MARMGEQPRRADRGKRRARRIRGLGVAMLVLGPVVAWADPRIGPEILRVNVDAARLARLPERTQTLVVGQPGVADVTLLKSGGLGVVTGKSFGETNLIALDAEGGLLGEWILRVGARRPDLVVQNGVNRESFICAPNCLPTVDLGDAKTISGDRAAAAAAHQAFSTGR